MVLEGSFSSTAYICNGKRRVQARRYPSRGLQISRQQGSIGMSLKFQRPTVQLIIYHNNTKQDLFLGKPLGLLALLDEHSNFPQATDVSLVTKFNDAFRKKKAIFIPSKGSASMTFSIQHYAGKASTACPL